MNEEAVLNVTVSDADGDDIVIEWAVDNGGNITPDATNGDKAVFSAGETGIYKVTVIAKDPDGLKSSKYVKIEVMEATLSISASARVIKTGEMATFTASMSSGESIPSSIVWTLVTKPEGSQSAITPNAATATLSPDTVGTYSVKATVLFYGVSYSDTVTLSATDESVSPDVEGTVTSVDGDTLHGAQVRLYHSTDSTIYDETAYTDEEGYYSFSEVPAGAYYLVVYGGNGYITQTQAVVVEGK